jgi:hypothetical protein
LTPRLVIVIELERVPVAYIDALTAGQEARLLDWLDAHPDFADIVWLAYRCAVELMREERAA